MLNELVSGIGTEGLILADSLAMTFYHTHELIPLVGWERRWGGNVGYEAGGSGDVDGKRLAEEADVCSAKRYAHGKLEERLLQGSEQLLTYAILL